MLNGFIVVRFGIPSLVATIGTWFFWGGIVLYGTGGKGAGTEFAHGFVSSLVTGRWHGIPAEFFWMVGIAIVLWVLLNRHRFGAHVYLVGDNEQSARMMGVRYYMATSSEPLTDANGMTKPGAIRWNVVSSKYPSSTSETNEADVFGEPFWSRVIVNSPQFVCTATRYVVSESSWDVGAW